MSEVSSSSAASSASSAAPSASSVEPSAPSAAPSEEPVQDEHELRRKDLAVLYPRNSTHAGHSVLPDSEHGQPQPSRVSAAPRGPSIAVTSVFIDSHVSSTRTVLLMPTADVVPAANNLPPMATIDVNHSLENRALNFPDSPDYNESDHMSVLCTHCSLNGKLSITQGGWRSPSSDGSFTPSLGWLNITFTDFADALELRLQGQDSGYMKFPMHPGNDEKQSLTLSGISLPGLGKAGLLLRPYLAVGWNLSSPTTINYCAGKLWQDAPTYLHVDFANLTNAASTLFASRALRTDPHTAPFHGRSMDALHAYGTISVRLELQLLVVFEEAANANDSSIPAAGLSGVPNAAASIRVDWPTVDAQFVARPVAEFDSICYAMSDATRAAYALWHGDDPRVAANFSADHPTVVRVHKRDASSAAARFGNLFPWVTDAERKALLKEGWSETHPENWDFSCYVWLEAEQRFEEAAVVLGMIKEGLEREDGAVAKATAAANTNEPELSDDGNEGLESGGTAGGVVMPTFVVGLVMAVAALLGF